MRWRLRLAAGLLGGVLATLALAATAAEAGPTWASLSPAQTQALAPLQRDWGSIDANRKQKWLEVASRFPTMPAADRQRLQERMAAWARMTPAERTRARLQFQEVRELPAEERQARWQAYQALPEDERKKLAQRAKPAAKPASGAEAGKPAPRSVAEQSNAKRNLVVPTVASPATRTVAPSVVQARPGATTTTMSTRATPPAHHQAGLPKIAATPGFVDPATLLPQRGPQGAAVRAAASTDPAEQP
jgi:hypothetical protein